MENKCIAGSAPRIIAIALGTYAKDPQSAANIQNQRGTKAPRTGKTQEIQFDEGGERNGRAQGRKSAHYGQEKTQ